MESKPWVTSGASWFSASTIYGGMKDSNLQSWFQERLLLLSTVQPWLVRCITSFLSSGIDTTLAIMSAGITRDGLEFGSWYLKQPSMDINPVSWMRQLIVFVVDTISWTKSECWRILVDSLMIRPLFPHSSQSLLVSNLAESPGTAWAKVLGTLMLMRWGTLITTAWQLHHEI